MHAVARRGQVPAGLASISIGGGSRAAARTGTGARTV